VSRSTLIGACYGALLGGPGPSGGPEGVPVPWLSLFRDGATVLQLARRLVDLRQDDREPASGAVAAS